MDGLLDHDATAQAELVASGSVSAAELVDAAIARIEAVNPAIEAVIFERFEAARLEAKSPRPGPLSGVPILLKDLGVSAMKGEPLESGSKAYRGYRAEHDAELFARLRRAGVIVLGRTKTPELGLLPTTEPKAFGPTRNPWDLQRTAGGSSGGSAAAVASRMVAVATAGDGGGSIRIPASCCGIFGLKPTRGRTPVGPDFAEIWSGFNADHVVTRTVRDSALVLDIIAGHCVGDLHAPPDPVEPFARAAQREPGQLTFACSTRPMLPADTIDAECEQAVKDAAALLEDLGHRIRWQDPPFDAHRFAGLFLRVVAANTAAAVRSAEAQLGRTLGPGDFETATWLAAKLGEALSGGEALEALAELRGMARGVLHFAEGVDAIVQPTVARVPPVLGFLEQSTAQRWFQAILARAPSGRLLRNPKLLEQLASEVYSFIPWTPVYNVTGQPSMSVPLSWTPGGLPVGVMITGRLYREDQLLSLASQLESASPWADRRPPI